VLLVYSDPQIFLHELFANALDDSRPETVRPEHKRAAGIRRRRDIFGLLRLKGQTPSQPPWKSKIFPARYARNVDRSRSASRCRKKSISCSNARPKDNSKPAWSSCRRLSSKRVRLSRIESPTPLSALGCGRLRCFNLTTFEPAIFGHIPTTKSSK
jgi:hypothetical protein